MAGAIAYATTTDVQSYVKGPTLSSGANGTLLTTLLLRASRMIDDFCERYFYPDSTGQKFFDGDGTSKLYVPRHDFYTVTVLKIALTENTDPTDPTQWYTISGDGVTPPSNFYLEPANPDNIGAVASQTARRPYYKIELPRQAKTNSTTDYLRAFTKGKRTVAITASWGWPQIPDDIKDLTAKIAYRLFRGSPSGWAGTEGAPEIGVTDVARVLDGNDMTTLTYYRRQVMF